MPVAMTLAEIEHSLPGRLRLRVRAKRGDRRFFDQTAAALAALHGVRAVRGNPVTASLLIEHDGDEAAVLASARERHLFETAPPTRAAVPRSGSAVAGERSVAPLDLAALGLGAAGLLQLARGRVLGSASENLWNAYGVYAATRQARVAAGLVALGLLQIVRGEILGSAVSLFLYALSARRMARGAATKDTVH